MCWGVYSVEWECGCVGCMWGVGSVCVVCVGCGEVWGDVYVWECVLCVYGCACVFRDRV